MKICEKCGAQNWDFNTVCEKCNSPIYEKGSILAKKETSCEASQRGGTVSSTYAEREAGENYYKNTSLTKASRILMIINTAGYALAWFVLLVVWVVFACLASESEAAALVAATLLLYMAIMLVPLLVSLFMTIKYCNDTADSHKAVGVGFKVCVLIFVSILIGVLMLVDERDNK